MHKDEWNRIIIMCISSARVWYVLGEAGLVLSECLFPSYWTQGGFVYLLVVSVPALSVEVWTQESLAEGFRWAQLLFLQDSHNRGCAEAPLSLWIRAKDLLPPLSLDINSANTQRFAPPCETPLAQQESPVPGEHLDSCQQGMHFSQTLFNATLSTLCSTDCRGLCAHIHAGSSTLGGGDFPRHQELPVLGNIGRESKLFSELKGMTPNSASCSFL